MLIDILTVLLYVIFVIASLVLILVILLQEGSGGGLAGAFGGAGSEAFGVKAGGINKFTGSMAGAFIVSAVALGSLKGCGDSLVTDLPEQTESAPALDEPADGSDDSSSSDSSETPESGEGSSDADSGEAEGSEEGGDGDEDGNGTSAGDSDGEKN